MFEIHQYGKKCLAFFFKIFKIHQMKQLCGFIQMFEIRSLKWFNCNWLVVREGGNAWTASENDFGQQLIIDLGSVMNITRIAIQGRPHSAEYVREFGVSYGYNGLDYADYKEPGGDTKVTRPLRLMAPPNLGWIRSSFDWIRS